MTISDLQRREAPLSTCNVGPEKAALYHCHRITRQRRREAEAGARKCLLSILRTGTHRGHNKVFLAAPRTPSSASVFLWFLRVTFSHPAFTAETRVECMRFCPAIHSTMVRGCRILVLRVLKCESVCAFLYAVAATLSCFQVTAVNQVGLASIRFICYLIDYPELTENACFR